MVGWVVSGLAPLVALGMAQATSGGPLTDMASRILGAPIGLASGSEPGSARVADTYGLIFLALAAIILTIWGLLPALLTLGEGVLGLGIIISTRHITPGALGGWLATYNALTVAIVVALVTTTANLEWMRREVARLRQGMSRERARIDAALDATPDGLAFYDSSGHVTQLNREARRLLVAPTLNGASGEDAPHVTWMRDGRALTREDWPDTRALRGEVVREEALALARKTNAGSVSWLEVSVSATPVMGQDGMIAGAVVTLRDVSEEAERSRGDRPPEQLRRMDTFIGLASHELRTPLTTIKASVELALRKLNRINQSEQIGEDMRQLLTRANQQVGRMTRLIENLMDTSRIASGRLTLRFERCDLLALAHEAVHDAQLRAPMRTIRLETDGEPAMVWGDPGRLTQAIGAYLSNALKFSDASQPVEVRLWGRWRADWTGDVGDGDDGDDGDGGQARVAVRDHGPGVHGEARERVWDRFYQDPALAARVGSEVGLGLGLYLCRAIMEAHHGAVGLEEAHGGGALFWLTAPTLPE